MWSAIVTFLISIFQMFVSGTAKSKQKAKEYVDYFQKWVKKTLTGAQISDKHDELFERETPQWEENEQLSGGSDIPKDNNDNSSL